jgi:hypothetical protein
MGVPPPPIQELMTLPTYTGGPPARASAGEAGAATAKTETRGLGGLIMTSTRQRTDSRTPPAGVKGPKRQSQEKAPRASGARNSEG